MNKKLFLIMATVGILLFPGYHPAQAAQSDYEISHEDANDGATMRAAINASFQALASNNSGSTEPATTYAHMWWADTTTGYLKRRNAANDGWITVISLTGTAAEGDASNIVFGSDAEDDIPVRGASDYGRLNITEQTLLGRITGGHVAPLSIGQVRTLLGLGTADTPTFAGLTFAKSSGVAGESCLYQANSTDTYGICDRGPASKTSAYNLIFIKPSTEPTAGQVVVNSAPNGSHEVTQSYATLPPVSYRAKASFNPQNVYDNDGTNHWLVLEPSLPAAVTITKLMVICDVDPTTEPTVTFKECDAGIGCGNPSTIEAVTTTAGVATVTSSIDDAAIAAGHKIIIVLSDPDNAILNMSVLVEGTY